MFSIIVLQHSVSLLPHATVTGVCVCSTAPAVDRHHQ